MLNFNKTTSYEIKTPVAGGVLNVGAATYNEQNDPMVIHVMPRKYINAKSDSGKNTKGTGILILIGGLLAMVGLLVFLYFYLFKSDYLKVGRDIIQNANKEPLNQVIKDINIKATSTKSNTEDLTASSTIASTTDTGLINSSSSTSDIISSSSVQSAADLQAIINASSTASSTLEMTSTTASSTEGQVVAKKLEKTNYKDGLDLDGDGLSDVEEEVIGTSPTSRDTDLDGYDDLSELKVLYNPLGGGKLVENKKIKVYNNSDYNYFTYYPASWTTEEIGGRESIMFRIDNQQFMQVVVQVNSKSQTIEDWYKEQFNASAVDSSLTLTKKGWTGLYSADGLTAYLLSSKKDHIFIVSYNPGGGTILNYKGIYALLINSLSTVN